MNYISEINSFYNWVMFNPLPPDAQALWHVLMQMNNRCAVKVNDEWYWRVEFSIPNMTLLSILAFSRQQLDRMRNVLIQAGRIVYKKGKGNQSGTYKIIPFDNTVVDNYVDNFPERLWITCPDSFVSHNVTQTVTQFDTQSGHKPLHKADTKENLCNIFGTQINSNNIKNNNIYNNSLCGGDDETHAHAHEKANEDNSLSDFLSEINSYFGMTEEIKMQIKHITEELFDKYFTRQPSKQDMLKVFEYVYRSESTGFRQANLSIDKDKRDVLEYAFSQASLSGNNNWAYIDGIFVNLRQRGLKTLDDCEDYDVDRDIAKNGF